MSEAFSAGAITKPPLGPLRAGIGFTPKIEPFSVSHYLCEQVEFAKTISGALIMQLLCSTIDPLCLSMSNHKLTPMFHIVCSTPGMISSLFSILSSPAAGIKPLLVSRSMQNSGRGIPTNDLTNSSIKCN